MQSEIEAISQRMRQGRKVSVSLEQGRADFDAFGQGFLPATDFELSSERIGPLDAEWVRPKQVVGEATILFFHGGAFTKGSIESHRPLAAELARQAGCRSLLFNYRLAPESPFPAQIEDTLRAYRWLLERVPAASIALAGDSAGGLLVVATLTAIRDAGLPLPSCGYCMSPWLDMEGLGESVRLKADVDPMVNLGAITGNAALFLGSADPRSPSVSPLYADLGGLPPLMIQVGTSEALFDDAVRLARLAGLANVDVTLRIWPYMIHIWQLFYRELRAGRDAIAEGGAYLARHMGIAA